MSKFKTIHTVYGLSLLTRAEATRSQINLTHMAVGDGNGNISSPNAEQTTLAREIFRAPVNRVFRDPDNQNRFTAELVIPASVGGFTLREVGIFDSDGSLFAVGNLPETYKPTVDDGACADTVVRIDFIASNADIITLKIDPNVAVATQTWISNNITAGTLIPGGTTYQVLRKRSNVDGDTEWHDPTTATVVVDVIEERQTLAANQTNVILNVVTTRGLAVYVNGARLPNDKSTGGWMPSASDPDSTVVLGKSYTSGSTIILAQNEPTGSVPYPLVRDLNLSDVPDKEAGRQNLGVHSKDESNAAGQAGDIKYTARTSAPAGWLKANGAAISRTAYAGLFAAIGTTYGAGDGFITFNLPDLRGVFLRGLDEGRGLDPGRTIGSYQSDGIVSHSHSATSWPSGAHGHDASIGTCAPHSHAPTMGWSGNHSHGVADPGHSHRIQNSHDIVGYGKAGVGSSAQEGDLYTDREGTGISIIGNGDHTHGLLIGDGGGHSHSISLSQVDPHTHYTVISDTGGSENRVKSVALVPLIKF